MLQLMALEQNLLAASRTRKQLTVQTSLSMANPAPISSRRSKVLCSCSSRSISSPSSVAATAEGLLPVEPQRKSPQPSPEATDAREALLRIGIVPVVIMPGCSGR